MDLHRLNDSIAEMHLKFTNFQGEGTSRRHMGRYVRKMQLMLTSMANFSVQTNIVDLDQTALNRAV